jgi:AhpD family alkylhydroperoxidase
MTPAIAARGRCDNIRHTVVDRDAFCDEGELQSANEDHAMHAERLLPSEIAPEGYKALRAVEVYLAHSGLPKILIELVKMRTAQINGCVYCLDVHSKDARRAGETEARLHLLNAWREAPHFSPAERAALAWTEALTNVSTTRAPDADYQALRAHFSDKEIVDLTYLIGMINFWTRLAIGMRYVPDTQG